MRLSLLLERTAEALPDRIATISRERERTWAAVHADMLATAGALAGLGVGRGEVVAVLAFNNDRWVDLYFALWRLGALAAPLNVRLAPFELAEQLKDCGATVLVTDAAHDALGIRLTAKSAIRHLSWSISPPSGAITLDAAMRGARSTSDAGVGDADPCGIFYTGGTSGRPKGVLVPHRSLFLHCLTNASVVPSAESGAFLHTAPIFHLSGVNGVVGGTGRGAQHVFIDKFEPGEALRVIAAHRPASLILAPVMLQRLLDHPDFTSSDLSSLQMLVYGSAPMPEALLRRAMAALPDVGFAQGYGMSEVAGSVATLGPADHCPDGPRAGRLCSAGKPTPLCELRIVDEEGRDAAAGAVGELWVRTPTLMLGYHNQPEETARAIVDGWYRTGDGGRIDGDGYLYIVDRMKDMIVSGGENVYSVEVEAALASHPAVAQAAVFGIPDDRWGEAVHAEVALRSGSAASADDIVEHCRARIAGYKLPRSIVIHEGELPTTPAGKIQKAELKAPYWEGRDRAVN